MKINPLLSATNLLVVLIFSALICTTLSAKTIDRYDAYVMEAIKQANEDLFLHKSMNIKALDSLMNLAHLENRTDSVGIYLYIKCIMMKGAYFIFKDDYVKATQLYLSSNQPYFSSENRNLIFSQLANIYLLLEDFEAYEDLMKEIQGIWRKDPSFEKDWYNSLKVYYRLQNNNDLIKERYSDSIKKYNELEINTSTNIVTISGGLLYRINFYATPSSFQQDWSQYLENKTQNDWVNFPIAEFGALAGYYTRHHENDSALKYFKLYYEKVKLLVADNRVLNPSYSATLRAYSSFLMEQKTVDYAELSSVQNTIIKLLELRYNIYKDYKNRVNDLKVQYQLNDVRGRISASDQNLDNLNDTKLLKVIVFLILLTLLVMLFLIIRSLNKPRQIPTDSLQTHLEKINLSVRSLIPDAKEDFSNPVDEEVRFRQALLNLHSGLTPTDVKILVLMRLGCSVKETAEHLNISLKGAESAKYRAFKKISLPENMSLYEYLNSI